MIERVIGVAIHTLTSGGIVAWANDRQVTDELLRCAIRELQDEQQRVVPLSTCLKHEYLMLTTTIRSEPLARLIEGTRYQQKSAFLAEAFLFLHGEPEISDLVCRHVFANWLTQADKPRPQRTKQSTFLKLFDSDPVIVTPQPSTSELSNYVMESVLGWLLLPSCGHVCVAVDREAARDPVLLTVLALELFAREHGQYPEKLDELVPDFLPAVPEDTHAPPKTPLRYRRDGDGALIYSVGENGTDDGGVFEKVEDIGYRIGKPREKTQE